MRTVVRGALAFGFAFVATRAFATDLLLRQKTTTTGAYNISTESTQYWTPTMMIVDEPAARMIIDFEAEMLTSIDKSKKTFVTISFDDMKTQMDALRRETEQKAADLPADAKPVLEGMGEAFSGQSHVEVKPTGKTEKIAGYDAEEYTFTGSAVTGSMWISKALPLPLGEKERAAFRKSTEGMKPPGMQFALAMDQVNGIPLRAVMNMQLGPNGTTSSNEVVEVRQESPPPDAMVVPVGFERATLKKPTAAAADSKTPE